MMRQNMTVLGNHAQSKTLQDSSSRLAVRQSDWRQGGQTRCLKYCKQLITESWLKHMWRECHKHRIQIHSTTSDFQLLQEEEQQNNAKKWERRFLEAEVTSHKPVPDVATSHIPLQFIYRIRWPSPSQLLGMNRAITNHASLATNSPTIMIWVHLVATCPNTSSTPHYRREVPCQLGPWIAYKPPMIGIGWYLNTSLPWLYKWDGHDWSFHIQIPFWMRGLYFWRQTYPLRCNTTGYNRIELWFGLPTRQ